MFFQLFCLCFCLSFSLRLGAFLYNRAITLVLMFHVCHIVITRSKSSRWSFPSHPALGISGPMQMMSLSVSLSLSLSLAWYILGKPYNHISFHVSCLSCVVIHHPRLWVGLQHFGGGMGLFQIHHNNTLRRCVQDENARSLSICSRRVG